MADFYINVLVDDQKLQVLKDAGLEGNIKEIGGKKAIQVGMSAKDQKKLLKGFDDLSFDADNACVLPSEGEAILMGIIGQLKTIDVMKVAISKLYNPLKGRDIFGRGTGGH
jgi:hypothetical protein